MCVPGKNMEIGITRHKSDLSALARKAVRRPTPELLEKIKAKKETIADAKKHLAEHLSWCDECLEDEPGR